MEILIIGFILVGLMVYASTRIKKRAAEAFEPEHIETDAYSIEKPEGFLHVIDSPDHDFEAYSKEFDEGDFRLRRGKIEIEVFPEGEFQNVVDSIVENATRAEVRSESQTVSVIEANEEANETRRFAVYKVVAGRGLVYRVRFAVTESYRDEYSDKIEKTLDSFTLKTG
jgi:hypothetical protein